MVWEDLTIFFSIYDFWKHIKRDSKTKLDIAGSRWAQKTELVNGSCGIADIKSNFQHRSKKHVA